MATKIYVTYDHRKLYAQIIKYIRKVDLAANLLYGCLLLMARYDMA
jgi:hypothetical protein